MSENVFTYYRVSTNRQGESGLGLEAQRATAKSYITSQSAKLLGEFTEIESGRKSNRPKLSEALAACQKYGATLVIAKLDRLARNVHFISGLLEANVRFVAVDMLNADRFMLHVYAAMAEEEARRISERTKAALQAAKHRGVKLGTACRQLADRHVRDADQFCLQLGPLVVEHQSEGLSIRKIAEKLNSDEVLSFSGRSWHPTTVQRLSRRFQQLSTIGKIPSPPCQ